MDTGIKHTHVLIVSLYLLQLLIRVILMAAAKKETVDKYTKAMRIPHIVLSILMLGTGIYLLVKAPAGIQPYTWVKLGLIALSIPLGVMGTKRNSIAFTGLSLLLLFGAMGLAFGKPSFLRTAATEAIDPGKADANLDMAKVKAGQVIYEQRCVLCHGGDGAAGFQKAANLTTSTMADAAVIDIIHKGKGVMPPNADLTDEQVEQVKEYVKYLRK
jgi:mono/diheme cytochrome c family protein